MYRFEFTFYAAGQFRKLTNVDRQRIKQKLLFWQEQKDACSFAKPLVNFGLATHRFRVGDYRIICRVDTQKNMILVLKVGHRRNIYRVK